MHTNTVSLSVWLIGAVVCLVAELRAQLLTGTDNGWLQLMPISCHYRDCKVLLVTNLTHTRSATASIGPLPFYL